MIRKRVICLLVVDSSLTIREGQGVGSIFEIPASSPSLQRPSIVPHQQQTENMADNKLLDLATPPACIAGRSIIIELITRSRTDPLQISVSSRWGHRQHLSPKRSLKCSACLRKAAWYTICIRPVQQWVSHIRLTTNKQCTSKTDNQRDLGMT